jgi:predicted transcriptional regulator
LEQIMSSRKKVPRYNVVSIRITDEEKGQLLEFTRQTRMSVSRVMREAFLQYTPPHGTTQQ